MPSFRFFKVIFQINCRHIHIINYRKKWSIISKKLNIVVESSERSLIWIKNSSGPSSDPWRNPASILVHEEYCAFKTTVCFLKFKKWVIISNEFFWNTILLSFACPCAVPYQMLLKCLKIYLEPQEHRQKIFKFQVIGRSWLIHESLGLKPDWLEYVKLFSVKNSNILLHNILSNIFRTTGSKDIHGSFSSFFYLLFCEQKPH